MMKSMVCLLLLSLSLAAEDVLAVKGVESAVPKEVPAEIRSLLDARAITVSRGDAKVLELWLRSELPSGADAEQVKNGLTWREIPETTLLGVVRFPKLFTDYRKQEIPAGLYSLRLAYQPETGDHKETAPHAEFALLVPIAKENSADTLDVKDLIKLSRQATAGDHPGVMLLFPAKKAKKEPVIADRGDGTVTIDVLRDVKAEGGRSSLGFGLTIAGVSKSR